MSLNGIDISHWQDGINLDNVPFDFCIMKATQGNHYVDECCDKFYQKVKNKGKLRGVYHYADGTGTAKEEAEWFLQNCKNYIGDAIIVLDWEETSIISNTKWAKEWLDYIYEKTGVRPLIYMSHSVTRKYDWKEVAQNYGLWVARYATNNTVNGYQSDPWIGNEGTGSFSIVAIHQYSSNGRLSGYTKALDLDIAYMSENSWKLYANPDGKAGVTEENEKTITIKAGETIVVKGV